MLKKIAISGMLLLMPLALFGASEKSDSERSAHTDQKLAAKIQKAVSKDRTLTPSSRNIDVSAQNGVFTLSGVVQSESERQAIQATAESKVIQKTPDAEVTEGAIKIDNKLAVAEH